MERYHGRNLSLGKGICKEAFVSTNSSFPIRPMGLIPDRVGPGPLSQYCEAHAIYEHALALLFWKQILTPRSYNSSPLFHSVWMGFELLARTRMSIAAYSTGSPGLFVLECNRQLHGPQLTRMRRSCQVNDSARNLQARLCSARFGVEAPTECNRTQLWHVSRTVNETSITGVSGARAAVCCWIRSVLFTMEGTPFAEPYCLWKKELASRH